MSTPPPLDVKIRILTSALFLFNRFGFTNVRLQHIADETTMSVGNLAYHFKTKDDLITALYADIVTRQRQLLADLCLVPIFANMNRFFVDTFALQQQYSFFYTDTLEVMRTYPTIRKTHRENLHSQMDQLVNWLAFNVARGALYPPLPPDTPERLANRILMQLESKLTFVSLTGQRANLLTANEYIGDLWSLLASQFTPTGENEFRDLTDNAVGE